MLDSKRWPQADGILDAALDLPPSEREDFVRRAAAGDGELLAALRAVLAEASASDGFLQPGTALSAPALDEATETDDEASAALSPGDRVGPYEVVAALGRGGMGEVYRARDTQLGREVALKVPLARRHPELASRLARESRLLASLNHPNIAAIYGVAESGGIPALVLELVEGPMLSERLESGPLDVREVLDIAGQIGEALQAAHERGIAHRDLKPSNVKLAANARVKVLDFGLAKAFGAEEEVGDQTDLTAVARRLGLAMGTAAYMSPEQARAAAVDHRADIWAFGCVIYEMLTARRAFEGRTATEVLARVLEREPDFSRLPAETPPALRRLLRRCLEKDVNRRLTHIHDAVLELDDARSELSGAAPMFAGGWWRSRLAAGAVATAVLVLLVIVGMPTTRAPSPIRSSPTRLALGIPASDELVRGFQPLAAIAPDGGTVVYRGRRAGTVRLFRRALGTLEPEAVPGTENATGPFFSPDGRWLAFDGDGILKKVLVTGGVATPICPAPGNVTGSWADDDTIVFATNTSRVLQRVRASGGEPENLTTLDVGAGHVQHAFPDALPGAKAVLFTIVRTDRREVAVLSLGNGAVTVVTNGSQPRFLSSGHLVFVRENAVWMAPFDAERLELRGEPVPVVERVDGRDTSSVHYAAARNGTLVYAPARPVQRQRLVWVDRSGRQEPAPFGPSEYRGLRISPGGTQVAFAASEKDNSDVWVGDLARGVTTRLTFEPTVESAPIWTRDARFVVFRSERDGGGIFRRARDGTGQIDRLLAGGGPILTPSSFQPDGRALLLTVFRGFRDQAIARADAEAGASPQPLLEGPFAQLRPEISPDGKWLAYQSDESGRYEIYVRPYPDVQAGRWQVSQGGGTTPRWRGDGRELYFHDGSGISAAAVHAGGTFRFSAARRVVETGAVQSRLGPEFDVAADGSRFLVIRDEPEEPPGRADLVVLQHWLQES